MSQKARSIAEVVPSLPTEIVEVVDRALSFQKVDRWPSAREMRAALAKAYEAVEHKPFPSAQRVSIGDLFPGADAPQPRSTASYDVAVSVVFEPDAKTSSIVVDFEDTSGKQDRYELRRKDLPAPGVPEDPTNELSEISVVEVD